MPLSIVSVLLNIINSKVFQKMKQNPVVVKTISCLIDYEADAITPNSRIVEYPFVLSRLLNAKPGTVLDVGCTAQSNYIIPTLCFCEWETWGIDLRDWKFIHPNFILVKQDIREFEFPSEYFDYVICISVLEHIGLASYYGYSSNGHDGDMKAINQITKVLKPNGKLLLTVPYYNSYVEKTGTRLFDDERLAKLLSDYRLVSQQAYVVNQDGYWMEWDRTMEKEGVLCLELAKK